MTSTRFNPTPDAPHGTCLTCSITLATEADTEQHMRDTTPSGGGRSHSTRATNPSRARRIQRVIDSIIEGAIRDALDEIEDITEVDITRAEARHALLPHGDFLDALEND